MRLVLTLVLAAGLPGSAWSAVPPKPPKPAEAAPEFNRPPRDKRAKLVEATEAGLPSSPFRYWENDGKRLLIVTQWSKADALKPFTIGDIEIVRGFGAGGGFLGRTANGDQFVESVSRGTGINASHQLITRSFGDGIRPGGTPLASTEYDQSADGYPAAVTPDGKTVFTILQKEIVPGNRGERIKWTLSVRALDGQSGEPQRTVAKVDGDEECTSYLFSTARDRLYLTVTTADAVVVRAVDTASGKVAWERAFTGMPYPSLLGSYNGLHLTANGDTLALPVRLLTEEPAPAPQPGRGPGGFPVGPGGGFGRPASRSLTSEIHLLDTATGKVRTPLEGQGTGINALLAIAPDGGLVAGLNVGSGRIDPGGRANYKLTIWNAKNGKPVKAWDTAATEREWFVEFVPNRPLVLLEEKSSLGLWDLSGLMK